MPVTLTAQFAVAPPSGSKLSWVFGPTARQAGLMRNAKSPNTVPNQTVYTEIVDYPAGIQVQASAQLVVTPPLTLCPAVIVGPINVKSCLNCPEKVEVALVDPRGGSRGVRPRALQPRLLVPLQWPAGTPLPAPAPTAYDWNITLPLGQVAEATTRGANTVATGPLAAPHVGWKGTGATAAGAVDFGQSGAYKITVTAKFPPSAGLPLRCRMELRIVISPAAQLSS